MPFDESIRFDSRFASKSLPRLAALFAEKLCFSVVTLLDPRLAARHMYRRMETILKRTNSNDGDFRSLVEQLDAYLAEVDGEEHSFFAQSTVSTRSRIP